MSETGGLTVTKPRRKFTREFKLAVLREIDAGKPIAQASREHEIHPTMIGQWRKMRAKYAERAFAGNGRTYKDEARVAELERKIGQLTMENDLLKKALQRLEMLEDAGSASKR
jgi:transposase